MKTAEEVSSLIPIGNKCLQQIDTPNHKSGDASFKIIKCPFFLPGYLMSNYCDLLEEGFDNCTKICGINE